MLVNNYVNISITTFNRLEFTKQAIASIVKYTTFPHVITVVDNASSDGTQEYLKELHSTRLIKNLVLLENNVGIAKASNLAWLQEPEALYYLKYDNDIVIQKNNWLSSLVSVINAIPEIGVIGYNLEPISYPLKVINNYKIRVKEKGNIGGACFLIPKRTHDILGYWCEDYGLYGCEDVDYSFRVELSGLLNAYMEEEHIGIHLPAGKAPLVNPASWSSSDGIEEFEYKNYRNFKDSHLRDAVESGIVSNKFDDYASRRCSLYISASLSSSSLGFKAKNNMENNCEDNNMQTYQCTTKTLRVDLGCGTRKNPDFVGVDVCSGPGIDIVADLNKKFPFDDNSVDEIQANDVIEHLQDRIHTMNEIWRVCKHGAKVNILVPSTDGRGAFQDPTHVSFWNINSFRYYCSEFPAYLELCGRYGFKGEFKILRLEEQESEDRVIHIVAQLSVVKSKSTLNQNIKNENSNLIIQDSQKQLTSDVDIYHERYEQEIFAHLSDEIQQYHKEPNSRTGIASIRQLRHQLTRQWLEVSDTDLQNAYQEELGKVHKILLNSGIKNEPLTITERSDVDGLVRKVAKDTKKEKYFQSLLSAMLYVNADRLSLEHTLTDIPDWFLPDYLKFLFSTPVNFHELGEATNYYNYLQGWMDYLHTSIFANLEDPFWQRVVNQFAQIANFIPAYFNKENLKYIYIKRSEIIELYLKNNGCELDYEFPERPAKHQKIRLGILAAHFTPSAETFATLPVYEYLSREFEVVLYSLQQTNHPLEQYCRSSANYFVTLPQNLSEQVNTIRADDLDLLFVATNVTAVTNQICLLATHRLARIQLTSGGSVVTTGIKNMDYFISGTLTDPSPIAQEQYREKLLQIAGAAHCFSYGNDQTKSTLKTDRETLGISEDAVIFTSGANFFKSTPELIHTWAKIIAEVPNSLLILFPFGPNWSSSYPKASFEKYLHGVFAEYGLSPNRVFALDPQPVPNREDLKEYFKIADVYLDSYPFAGTTSLIEPLQISLPVIARKGNSFRSAMGAAMIQSLDIPDLVADSEKSYIQLAIELGNNAELRQQKRSEIEAKMRNNPSFLDSRSYSAKIGNLFREIFNKYNSDTLNQSLRLRDVNLMIFPDWNQSEEEVGLELQQVIQTLATQSVDKQTTLLIDTTNIAIEDAEMFLSSVTMNLMMEEDLNISEELEISLIEDLSDIQWATLLPKIDARIVMECDNQAAVGKLLFSELSQLEIGSFMRSTPFPLKERRKG